MKELLKKIKSLLEMLSSKPRIGGLRITDSAVQFMLLKRGGDIIESAFALPLPPGAVLDGKIADREEVVRALSKLKEFVHKNDKGNPVRVVVALPPGITYVQSFNIPNVGLERLPRTANLNLRMISPVPAGQAYMSWHTIRETRDAYELLGVFAEQKVIDAYRDVLERVGFYPVVFEPQSLSLSWAVADALGPREDPMLVLSITSDGLDMFLIKDGSVHFDYFHSWRSIQGNDTKIKKEYFYGIIEEEVRKVINFVSGRFREKLQYVLLNTPGIEKEMKQALGERFSVKVSPLTSRFERLSPRWMTVLGAAVRGGWDRSRDVYASLGTERVQIAFHREQAIEFIRLWRNIAAAALGIFCLLFGGVLLIMRAQPRDLEERLGTFDTEAQEAELSKIASTAEEFNAIVSGIGKLRAEEMPIIQIIGALRSMGAKYNVTINEITLGGGTAAVQAVLTAPSYQTVNTFKKALAEDGRFEDVDIPLTAVTPTKNNFVRFNLRFGFVQESP